MSNKRTYIGVIYRAPPNGRHTEIELAQLTFLQTLRDILNTSTRFGHQCIIMGDLNLDLLDLSNRIVNDYKDLMLEF